jgi:hypothetical protein
MRATFSIVRPPTYGVMIRPAQSAIMPVKVLACRGQRTASWREYPYRRSSPHRTADRRRDVECIPSDRMRPLAVTSLQRSKKYPDLPTMDEAGVKGYEVNTMDGILRAGQHAEAIAAAIETAIKETVAMPDVRARFETAAANVRSGAAEEMRQLLATDVAKWAKLVKEQNIKLSN